MIRYVLSRPARADLRNIREWIRKDNPPRAITFVAELLACFSTLIEQPMLGRSRPDLGQGVRVLVHGNYLIVYRATGDQILISRVIHGRRDLGRSNSAVRLEVEAAFLAHRLFRLLCRCPIP